MNNWIKGLKEYNKDSDSWCIPKKGSKGYNEIMNKKKPIKESPRAVANIFITPNELFSKKTKTVIPKKQYTMKEIQEMRDKSEKFSRETARLNRNAVKKIMGVGRYAAVSKEPSTPIDYVKEKKEYKEMMERIKPKKKSGVLL